MAHKRNGQLTVSGEWARHLRPYFRRVFWKKERAAEKTMLQTEVNREAIPGNVEDMHVKSSGDNAKDTR